MYINDDKILRFKYDNEKNIFILYIHIKKHLKFF